MVMQLRTLLGQVVALSFQIFCHLLSQREEIVVVLSRGTFSGELGDPKLYVEVLTRFATGWTSFGLRPSMRLYG